MDKILRKIGQKKKKKNGEADPNSQCHEWKRRCYSRSCGYNRDRKKVF